MLILCIGPDSFRAVEKARELEQAFRKKFDPDGTSVERLWTDGETPLAERRLNEQIRSVCLSRRFMRTTDLIRAARSRQQALVPAFSKDSENVIVVSVENEIPNEQARKFFHSSKLSAMISFSSRGGLFRMGSERATQGSSKTNKGSTHHRAKRRYLVRFKRVMKLAAGVRSKMTSRPTARLGMMSRMILFKIAEWRARLFDSGRFRRNACIFSANPIFYAYEIKRDRVFRRLS